MAIISKKYSEVKLKPSTNIKKIPGFEKSKNPNFKKQSQHLDSVLINCEWKLDYMPTILSELA